MYSTAVNECISRDVKAILAKRRWELDGEVIAIVESTCEAIALVYSVDGTATQQFLDSSFQLRHRSFISFSFERCTEMEYLFDLRSFEKT